VPADALVNAAAVTERGPARLMEEVIRILGREAARARSPTSARHPHPRCPRRDAEAPPARERSDGGLRRATATEGEHHIQTNDPAAAVGWLENAVATEACGRLIDPRGVARAVALPASAEAGIIIGSTRDDARPARGRP
jgi:hypothetical protein